MLSSMTIAAPHALHNSLITPRMRVAHVVGRRVGKRTERFQRWRCRLVHGHLVQHPRNVLTDIDFRLEVVLDETMSLSTYNKESGLGLDTL